MLPGASSASSSSTVAIPTSGAAPSNADGERADVQFDALAVHLEPRLTGHPLGGFEADAPHVEAGGRSLLGEELVSCAVARTADVAVGVRVAEGMQSLAGVHAWLLSARPRVSVRVAAR